MLYVVCAVCHVWRVCAVRCVCCMRACAWKFLPSCGSTQMRQGGLLLSEANERKGCGNIRSGNALSIPTRPCGRRSPISAEASATQRYPPHRHSHAPSLRSDSHSSASASTAAAAAAVAIQAFVRVKRTKLRTGLHASTALKLTGSRCKTIRTKMSAGMSPTNPSEAACRRTATSKR